MRMLALALTLILTGTARAERFDQIHFGVNPETKILAVTVAADQKKLWRLWPEEVKIEHKSGALEYTFSYSNTSGPISLLKSASTEKKISAPCQAEAKRLTSEPKEAIAPENLVTTIYLNVESPHQERLTLTAGEGLKILGVQPLQTKGESTTGIATLDKWTRAVAIEIEYNAGYSVSFGPSDILILPAAEKGQFQVIPQKEGLAALKAFSKDQLISESCWKELTKEYWGPPTDSSDPKYRSKKTITAVLPIQPEGNRDIRLEATEGLRIKAVEVLE